MSRKIHRYTLTVKEQGLWEKEEMQGWRDSMVGCVEDDAREEGCKKFVVYDRAENIIAKGDVRKLPEPEAVAPTT
ncbi:MAG: hypothetical protein HYV27_14560 [Candidatus Hydrogenedentes bacterium]|nr:hypothetical protein [Candidatus Hydrogenedentota bacterium]